MKKGTAVLYNGEVLKVWEKKGNAVKLYNPLAKLPELTMQIVSINKVKAI